MNTRLTIINVLNNDNKKLILEIDHSLSLANLHASGQMLVDSDGTSFIYLLEKEDVYTYLALPENVWNELKIIFQKNLPVYVSNGSEQILLTQFIGELQYLIENIKGNTNYGEKMVSKVEAVFV